MIGVSSLMLAVGLLLSAAVASSSITDNPQQQQSNNAISVIQHEANVLDAVAVDGRDDLINVEDSPASEKPTATSAKDYMITSF